MDLVQLTIFIGDIFDVSTVSQLNAVITLIKRLITMIGSFIIVIGALYSVCQFIAKIWNKPPSHQAFNFDMVRLDLGRTIILGLEFFIAADVIETTLTPDYYALGILAVLVVIRTFLTYTLNKELAALIERQQEQQEKLN